MTTPAPSLRRPACAVLVAAPCLLTLADVLQVVRHASIAWTVVMWAAFVLFVPAVFVLARVLRPAAPRLALVAGSLALVGTMAGAAMQVLFRVVLTLEGAGLDPQVQAAATQALRGSFPLSASTLFPGALFPLGLMLFGAGLAWARRVAVPGALLLVLGGVLFPVGHAAGIAPALIGGDLVLLAALGWIARELAARPELWGERADGARGARAPLAGAVA